MKIKNIIALKGYTSKNGMKIKNIIAKKGYMSAITQIYNDINSPN